MIANGLTTIFLTLKPMASLNLNDYPSTIFMNGKSSRITDDTHEGVILFYKKIPGTYSSIMGTSEYELISVCGNCHPSAVAFIKPSPKVAPLDDCLPF